MILAPLAGMLMVITVSAGPIHEFDPTAERLTAGEKDAAMRPLVQRATDCITTRVAGDERYERLAGAGNLGDLIVDSVPPCLDAIRAMIDAYDHYFGEGKGEAFFMGPYLDVLPQAVMRRRQSDRHTSAIPADAPR